MAIGGGSLFLCELQPLAVAVHHGPRKAEVCRLVRVDPFLSMLGASRGISRGPHESRPPPLKQWIMSFSRIVGAADVWYYVLALLHGVLKLIADLFIELRGCWGVKVKECLPHPLVWFTCDFYSSLCLICQHCFVICTYSTVDIFNK